MNNTNESDSENNIANENDQSEVYQFFHNLNCPIDLSILENCVNASINNENNTIECKKIKTLNNDPILMYLLYRENTFHITIFKCGLKFFSGQVNRLFQKHGNCIFYENGIKVKEEMYENGKKEGIVILYDENVNVKSIENYHDDNIQNKVLVRNNKIYLDARVNGNGNYGEGAQLENSYIFHGLVVNYKEDQEQVLFHYDRNCIQYRIASFSHIDDHDILIEYTQEGHVSYIGEYMFDRETLQYTYEGNGLKFSIQNNQSCCLYKGSFKQGLYDGFGCLYNQESHLKEYEGEWKEGKLIAGRQFQDGIESIMRVHTIQDIIKFPKTKNHMVINEGAFPDIQEFPYFNNNVLSHVIEIKCMYNCLSNLREFLIEKHASLQKLEIESDCLMNVEVFSITHCSNLSSLIIGSHCMNIATKFILETLPHLELICIGNSSFTQCSCLTLYNIHPTLIQIPDSSFTEVKEIITEANLNDDPIACFINNSKNVNRIKTSYHVTDFTAITKEACRALYLEKSFRSTNALVDLISFTKLESFEMAANCSYTFDSFILQNTLQYLQTLVIHSNCNNQTISTSYCDFIIQSLPSLQSIQIDNHSFISFSSFKILSCPALQSIHIGTSYEYTSLFSLEKCSCFSTAQQFTLSQLPSLTEVAIGNGCFTSSCEVMISECNKMKRLQLGSLCFCNCSKCSMNGLMALEEIILLPFALYRCKDMNISNVNNEVLIQSSSFDHFKAMKNKNICIFLIL